jgi:hypothetical protein
MFEELLVTIDRTTVRTFFNNLPRFVAQVQQQQLTGQAARTREIKVGPNEPCPCGSGKKFKKCHGAVGRTAAPASASRAVAALKTAPAVAPGAVGDGAAAAAPPGPKLTQQQQRNQAPQEGQRRKSKGRAVPTRRS